MRSIAGHVAPAEACLVSSSASPPPVPALLYRRLIMPAMLMSPAKLPDQPDLNYATLLAKHGYSAAGYAATVQEAVDSLLGNSVAAHPTPPREALADAVEDQLFHLVLTRIASPTLVLEQLQAFFALGQSWQTSAVTLYLLQRLGPLQQSGFYHPRPAYLPAQVV